MKVYLIIPMFNNNIFVPKAQATKSPEKGEIYFLEWKIKQLLKEKKHYVNNVEYEEYFKEQDKNIEKYQEKIKILNEILCNKN